MINIKYGYRRHCGGLLESLKTSHYLTKEQFAKLLSEYVYYGYDERCKQFLFKLRNMENRINFLVDPNASDNVARTWLFIEVNKNANR